jgi:hypothetical protein
VLPEDSREHNGPPSHDQERCVPVGQLPLTIAGMRREVSGAYAAEEDDMTTEKQRAAARRNVKKAAKTARAKKSIASMPKKTRTALGKQGAAMAERKRSGRPVPKSRQELYEEA